ncbi:MAG: GGDEF domain-containing protein [Gammaproteobacteria bacterium]|nr:GGDEF domain-containing protein [Gammaproteobacteria bacterium]
MEHQLPSEEAKLSLVGKRGHAIDVTEPQALYENADDIAARLPAVLQTSLELDDIISLFHKEMSKALAYDSLHYQHRGLHCDVSFGQRSHHSCNYRLEMSSHWLGELTLTRRKKFTDTDTQLLEDFLCKLIYPVRNCLLFREAQAAALQDKLTGLNNRAAYDSSLKREIDLAHRQHAPMSLIVLDIDHFKAVNDTYGHLSGDVALQALAKSITTTMRLSDIAFRYGGEEFALILSNTDAKAAQLVAERIRVAVSQLSCNDGKRTFGFTVSLGVAQLNQGENGSSLFDRADQALYQAKKSGRNQTLCSDTPISKELN